MVLGTKELCRRVLRNQHKLRRIIQQQIRLCNNAASLKNFQQQQQQAINYDDNSDENAAPTIATTIPSQYATVIPKKIEHDADVGQQFYASQLNVRLAAPHQLQPKPEADDLVFGKYFTDHMLKISYHKSLGGWQKPEITPLENLVLHPAAKVLHYAIELFEGMKAYRGTDGRIRLFRPNMNMNRMNFTAKRCGLPTFEGNEFIECMRRLITIDQEWVPHTDEASLYIRPTLIGIDPTLGVASSHSALLYTILSPVGSYFKSTKAISLLADPQYIRAWPGGVGDRKVGSNYAPTLYVQNEASKRGLNQVLWLYGEDHQLTEVGLMNIFVFYVNDKGEKVLATPPLNGLILPGVTRDSILALSREMGEYKVQEQKITMPMICKLLGEGRVLELFGAGTAAVVSPINRISYLGQDLFIPTLEQEKPVWELMKNTLINIQYGKIEHPWSVVID